MEYGLKVTKVHLRLRDGKGMKAICNVIVNGMLAINDIRVIQGHDNSLFVAMPSKKMPNGDFKDMCNPVNAEARRVIEEAVLHEYHRATTLSDELLALIL